MTPTRILYVCHNHPVVRPGGAEAYALELHRAFCQMGDFEPVFLARIDAAQWADYSPDAPIGQVAGTRDEYFFGTSGVDPFFMSAPDKTLYTRHFRQFLLRHRPDIVHFQHTLHLGFDLIREVRNTLPGAPIVYTLHEFVPICHRSGQMLRVDDERCYEATPDRCHECFPYVQPREFLLRRKFIESHLSLVDLFIAPSRFLRDRYIDWGIPPEKILFEDYGRLLERTPDGTERTARNRLGYFGQFTYFKGVHVLLQAMRLLRPAPEPAPRLSVHGANLELQPQAFQRRLRGLLEETDDVTLLGRYDHSALPSLMADIDWVVVPSIWWENSPLVIQEAFCHERPVICSDIGGMAEKVRHGVDGLHFRANDPADLARVIGEAVTTPGLWRRLQSNIRDVHGMEGHAEAVRGIYAALLGGRVPRSA